MAASGILRSVPCSRLLTWCLLVSVASAASLARGRSLKPCPQGFQAISVGGKQDCVCAPYHVYWPATGTCHPQFTRGPCGHGQHIVANASGHAHCKCPGLWARWEDGSCYQEYSRGPCPVGELFMKDGEGNGFCSCSPDHQMFYYQETQMCYPLYERGPCNRGHILKFDYASRRPRCACRDGHVLEEDGTCYPLNTAGPCDQDGCEQGINCYVKNLDTLKTECKCLPGNVTTADGHCFQPYSRGPCSLGHWLVFSEPGVAVCKVKEHCTKFDNWFYSPEHQRCYRQYSQGPCPDGSLFYLDRSTGMTSCDCRKEWTPYFYEQDERCYEQHSVGPCKAGKYFSFNTTSKKTECNCFTSHVLDPDTDTCYEKLTRGPCLEGELVVAHRSTGLLKCACSPELSQHYWKDTDRCYPHFQRGPCPSGQSFRPSPHGGDPVCVVWG